MPNTDDLLVVTHLTDSQDALEQVVRINGLAWGQTLDATATSDRVAQLRGLVAASNPEEECLLIAVRGGEVAGFARATRDDGGGSPWMFSRLVVHPDHQRCGVATKLCEACIAHAKGNGATVLLSETHLDNAGSLAFHAAFGFTNEGEFSRSDDDKKVRFSYSFTP